VPVCLLASQCVRYVDLVTLTFDLITVEIMVVVLGATHAILQDYSFTNSVTFRIRDLII